MKQLRIPPLLIDIVQSGLLICDGIVFDNRDTCPLCGGSLSGYDTKKKQFCILREDEKLRAVHVFVKRFTCRQCRTLCYADEPFYPDTRMGSPLVDLCVTLSTRMPFYRATVFIEHLGIHIDRGTIRNYARRSYPDVTTTDLFGIHLPLSILSLSELAVRSGEGGCIEGTEALAACGFPSAYRAAPNHLPAPEQGNPRKEEENKEEQQAYPP